MSAHHKHITWGGNHKFNLAAVQIRGPIITGLCMINRCYACDVYLKRINIIDG